jgi:hypothetical protein
LSRSAKSATVKVCSLFSFVLTPSIPLYILYFYFLIFTFIFSCFFLIFLFYVSCTELWDLFLTCRPNCTWFFFQLGYDFYCFHRFPQPLSFISGVNEICYSAAIIFCSSTLQFCSSVDIAHFIFFSSIFFSFFHYFIFTLLFMFS